MTIADWLNVLAVSVLIAFASGVGCLAIVATYDPPRFLRFLAWCRDHEPWWW